MIRLRCPWQGLEAVEFATLEWVDWFDNRRILEPIADRPPTEAEARTIGKPSTRRWPRDSHKTVSGIPGAVQRAGSIYLWLVGSKGFTLFHATEQFREGKPTNMERVDSNGLPFPKLLIGGALREGRKFLRYYYDDPEITGDEDTGSPKFGYAVSFNAPKSDQKVVVGSGIYLKAAE